jgi:hypothetical protein
MDFLTPFAESLGVVVGIITGIGAILYPIWRFIIKPNITVTLSGYINSLTKTQADLEQTIKDIDSIIKENCMLKKDISEVKLAQTKNDGEHKEILKYLKRSSALQRKLVTSLLSALRGLKALGANGTVEEEISGLQEFLVELNDVKDFE